ncbi:MAG TPA: 50S ribosomal protein L25 [Pseudobdellovibrionaceae bacterium]|nr:50S ribosomal protein L25 [Pseudobdellovibrionaceae bacterium]
MTTQGQRPEIQVQARETGKGPSRAIRTKEMVPGVVYGPKTKPINVMTDELTVRRYSSAKFESTIFQLKSDDKTLNQMAVLLRGIQVHPVNRRPQHIDFYAIDMDSKLRVTVQLRIEGKPAGASEGGVLEWVMREIEVECRPLDIPAEIVADVSHLGVGDALHVSDLKLPANLRVMTSGTLTIAICAVPKEEVAAPVAAATPEAGAAAAPAAGAAAAPAAEAGKDKK